MRAVQLRSPGGLDRLQLVDLSEPAAPLAGEVRVRLRASSLNFHDLAVVNGSIKTRDGRIPMSDGAAEVLAVGEGVTAFKPGDLVMSTFFPSWLDGDPRDGVMAAVPGDGTDGFAREQATLPAECFTHVPRGYSATEAATLPCAALTAWRALVVNGRMRAGQVVLVQGSGGVSVFALQFAKAMGATVIATSSSDEKLSRLRELGADHLINYRQVEKWGAAARDLTGGQGVDHVVEVGGADTLNQSISATRVGGHIALIGVLSGIQGQVQTALLMRKQLRLLGLTVGSRQDQLEMIRAIEATKIRPVIDASFALADLAAAFHHQAAGRHFGKIGVHI